MCLRLFTCQAVCKKTKKKSFYFYCPEGYCAPWMSFIFPWPIEQDLYCSGFCAIKLLTNSLLYTCINEEIFFFFLLQWRKALTIAWKLVNIAWPDVPASGEVPRVTDCACDVEFEIRVVEASWGGSSFLLGYTVFSTSWTGRFHLLCGHGMKPARTLGRHSCLKNTIDTSTSHFFFTALEVYRVRWIFVEEFNSRKRN